MNRPGAAPSHLIDLLILSDDDDFADRVGVLSGRPAHRVMRVVGLAAARLLALESEQGFVFLVASWDDAGAIEKVLEELRAQGDDRFVYSLVMLHASEEMQQLPSVDDFLAVSAGDVALQRRLHVALRLLDLQRGRNEALAELRRVNHHLQRDLQVAARVQRSLLPRRPPDVEGCQAVWRLAACSELAGDILNIFPVNDDLLVCYILDVSGHGVASALLSVQLSRVLSDQVGGSLLFGGGEEARLLPPPRVVDRLNLVFPMERPTLQFFTLILGYYRPSTGHFRYTCAGNPLPLHLPADGSSGYVGAADPVVGMFPESDYTEQELTLAPGDRLLLCTDGVIEALSPEGELFGPERMAAFLDAHRLEPSAAILDDLLATVRAWTGHNALQDDCSLLMLGRSSAQR